MVWLRVISFSGTGTTCDHELVDLSGRIRHREVDYTRSMPTVVEIVPELRTREVGRIGEMHRTILGVDSFPPVDAKLSRILP
jgi:hypothetical protein